MSLIFTWATARRVLTQLLRDHRTVALLIVVPSVLLGLLRAVFDGQPEVFGRVGLQLLGVFPFITMFLVTSIAMLRERTSGTLERLLTTRLHKIDLLAGYGLAFSAAAAVQAMVASLIAFWLLDVETAAPKILVIVVAIGNALLGMALGLFVSAFAQTEFQAVQFMPAVVLPQLLICGLLIPRALMSSWLEHISDFVPMTYSLDALNQLLTSNTITGDLAKDLGIITGCVVVGLLLAAATLRRRSQ